MKIRDDNAREWYHFTLKCDCGTSVQPCWVVCPVCMKPISKPKFGKLDEYRISLSSSEIVKIVAKEMFNSEENKEVKESK
jgi:hypothetical protein